VQNPLAQHLNYSRANASGLSGTAIVQFDEDPPDKANCTSGRHLTHGYRWVTGGYQKGVYERATGDLWQFACATRSQPL